MQIGSTGFNAEEEFRPQRRKRLLSAYDAVRPARPAAPASRASRRGKVTGFTLGGGAATEDESAAPVRLGDTLPAEDTQRIAESFLTPEGRQETQTQKRMRDTTTREGAMAAFDKVRLRRVTRGEEGNDPARQRFLDQVDARIAGGEELDPDWLKEELRLLTEAQSAKEVEDAMALPFGPTEFAQTRGQKEWAESGLVKRVAEPIGKAIGDTMVGAYRTGLKGIAQLTGQTPAAFEGDLEPTEGAKIARGAASALPYAVPGIGHAAMIEGGVRAGATLGAGEGAWKAVNEIVPVQMVLKAFDPAATTEERTAGIVAAVAMGHGAARSVGKATRSGAEALGRLSDRLRSASEPQARILADQVDGLAKADPDAVESAFAEVSKPGDTPGVKTPETLGASEPVKTGDIIAAVMEPSGTGPVRPNPIDYPDRLKGLPRYQRAEAAIAAGRTQEAAPKRYYRETTLDSWFDEGYRSPGKHWAESPDFALGQGDNKGVIVEFEPRPGARLGKSASKPAAVGEAQEWVAGGHQPTVNGLLPGDTVSVTVKPGVKMSPTVKRWFDSGPGKDWAREPMPDGSVKYTNPKYAKSPGTVEAPASGSSPIPTRPGTPEAPPTTVGPLLEAGKVQERPNLSTPDEGTIRPDAGAPGQQEGVRGGGEVPPGVVSGRVPSASEAPRPAGPPEGIAHADTAAWRKEAGLDPYVKTRYKVNQYSEEAVGRGHADNALSIADQVNSGQKTSADRFEQEGLRLGFHKVKLELKDIEAAKSDAIEAGDPAALAEAETAYQDAMGRGDRITKALDKVGSEAGGTLGARAYDLIDEGDSLDLRRKVQSTTGEKVSAKDQARLDEVAAKVKALEAEVDRLTKLAGDPNRVIRNSSRSGRANPTGRAGRVSQADFQAAKEKLLTVVKPGALGSGFGGFEVNWTPEHYAALKTAVRYVVQNTPGLRNLEQPYEGLKSKVQEMFGDIPDHLLRQAVVDELGSPRAVTREQMTARAKENAARRQARRAVTEIVEEAKDRQRTWEQKRARDIAGVLSVPRRMMTFFDDSAVGRQGLFLATTHPQAAAKAFVRQWEVVKKDGFGTVMGRLENDPLYDEFRGAGGYLADPLNGVREEGFVHSFLDKIPGLNKAMQGSEELMAAYLNVLRFESYKALRDGLSIGGHEPTVPELKWAAGMVNVASGRGIGPGEGGKASRVANQFFFSPQLLVARMRMATGEQAVQGFRASGRAGALASAEYAKYLAARAALATLLASVGGKTQTDVKDKEFGQTRFGKLKVETSGGMDASAGLVWGTLAQALERTPAPYGKGVVDRAGRFLGNRLSPVAGYVRGAVDKKDFKGDPFQPGREAVKMLGPIHIVNQLDGSLEKEGAKPEDRAKMLILETFGFSTSFYDRTASSKGPASPPEPSKPPSPPKPGLSRHRR